MLVVCIITVDFFLYICYCGFAGYEGYDKRLTVFLCHVGVLFANCTARMREALQGGRTAQVQGKLTLWPTDLWNGKENV